MTPPEIARNVSVRRAVASSRPVIRAESIANAEDFAEKKRKRLTRGTSRSTDRRDEANARARAYGSISISVARFRLVARAAGCGGRARANGGSLRQVREFQAKIAGIGGEGHAGFEIDDAIANKFFDHAVEVLHAVGVAVAHGVEQGLALAFALFDVVAGAHGGFQNLDGGDAALAVLPGQQALRNDVAERFAEARADRLLIG